MSKLDEIFRKRLERIREELNSYIDLHLLISEHKISVPARECATVEKKKGGVNPKFLNYMKLNDPEGEYLDSDYLDDEVDECLSTPTPAPEKKETYALGGTKESSITYSSEFSSRCSNGICKDSGFLKEG